MTIQPRKGSDLAATSLRLPRELVTQLKIQAIRAGRSLNTHVAMILGKAAGVEFGHTPPAAGTDQEMIHQEAHSHAAG